MSISIKINLRQLVSGIINIKGKSGKPTKCLVLPIIDNNFIEGEKGLYLDMICFEIKEKRNDSKDTHLVKQSFSKDTRERMTEKELRELPILGNVIDWDRLTPGEPEPKTYDISGSVETGSDDLPF